MTDPRTTEIQARVDARRSSMTKSQADVDRQYLLATNARLQAQIDAVKALHNDNATRWCMECSSEDELVRKPCPTVQAITDVTGGDQP